MTTLLTFRREKAPSTAPTLFHPETSDGKFTLFLEWSYLNANYRVVMLDETDEAPGVQGIGIPRLVFWVWQDGDGHSPNGMTRDPWFGTYWKV